MPIFPTNNCEYNITTSSFSEQVVTLLLSRKIKFTDQLEENIAFLENYLSTVDYELKFEITNSCNLNCSFCHQRFGIQQKSINYFELDYFRTIISQACQEKHIKYIRITGGEPMLHPDCLAFLKSVKDAGLKTILNTNATLLTSEIFKEYKNLVDIWKISLPSYDRESLDSITGKGGIWEQKLNALSLLKQENAIVDILVVLSHNNILHLDDFFTILNQYPQFTMTFLRQESNATFRKPLNVEDIRLCLNHLSKKNGAIALALPLCALPESEGLDKIAFGRIECGPWCSLVVNSDGQVRQCYSRRKLYPKLPTYVDTAISLAAQDFASLPEVCLNCKFGARCLGGCRCPLSCFKSPYGMMDYLAVPHNLSPMAIGEKGVANE